MNQLELETIVKNLSTHNTGHEGAVEFYIDGRCMYLISDRCYDRMRIYAPIASLDKLSPQQIQNALEANFHTSMDARYAVNNQVLYATFLHPLGSLSEDQVQSAVIQVFNLASSFGSQYSSGMLTFDDQAIEAIAH